MKKENKLKIIPLGGMHEIGKNLTVLEYDGDIVLVDCGLTFPEDEQLGVDIVIPDFSYLINNKDRIKGLLITHGHEDHIGGIPYLLKEVNVPLYGTKLTLGLVKPKLMEHNIKNAVKNIVKHGEVFKLGKFEVEFIKTGHSIPDSAAIAIKSPVGTVIHTGDFKVDFTPIMGDAIDLNKFAEYGSNGVLALMSDSTNATRSGYSISERAVGETFNQIFAQTKTRIIIATFASNIHRIQQIINAAEKYGRKIALSGRSMINVTNVAFEMGYLKAKEDTIIDLREVDRFPIEKVAIITTGSQGEPMSALTRIAYGEHKQIKLSPLDTVILSANPIPGNEKTVFKIINKLMERGAKVIYETLSEIHVSGHAYQEELKLILSLVKPKYFIPSHGETLHLMKHAGLGVDMGIPKSDIFIMENGDCLEFGKDSVKKGKSVVAGNVLVDGLGVGDVGQIVLRDRKHLSEDGLIAVVVTISKQGSVIVAGPDIISRGFVYVKESEDMMEKSRKLVYEVVEDCLERGMTDWSELKTAIRESLRKFIYSEIKRNPMILPIIMEV
ncbi:MAG: ribonuclease J [Tissierellia bacterium]|nr:ribonuclease J [Tissierellia bacterium]